ncbi:MAG: sigma-70 family RNA polymerase sigma factor [Planctomycetales bacterium]
MSDSGVPAEGALEKYRQYLALIARLQLDPQWNGKVDLSGVVQQTLFEAHQGQARFAGDESGARLAWLRRILANNLADEIRKLNTDKRDVGRELSLEASVEQSSQRMEAWLAVEDTSPSGQMHREELSLKLVAALQRLPEAQREALVLQHWQGWPLARIAEHMGKTRTAVAGLLKRGLQQLREEMRSANP